MAGLPEPTELPKRATVAANKPMRKMEGFGSGSVPTQNQGPGRGRIGVYVLAVGLIAWYLLKH
jgi:hypothetical protein